MTAYRTGNHHGVTIVAEGEGARCGREGHDCARGHLVAVVVEGGEEFAERICALLNCEEAPEPCQAETHSWQHFTAEQVDSYWIRCTLQGPHDEHQDEHTGLAWRRAEGGPETAPVSTESDLQGSVVGQVAPRVAEGDLGAWNRFHPTCIEVTGHAALSAGVREYLCGPDCPRGDA